MKRALITGITGQDGSYMAEFLLKKGYQVFGTLEKGIDRSNISSIENDLGLFVADLLEPEMFNRVLVLARPDEVYHFAALTSPAESFEIPGLYAKVTGEGAIKLMHKVRDFSKTIKFFQPSAAAMFDTTTENPQTEKTPFMVTSPYAGAKIFAHEAAERFRQSGMFISCGIFFNHESPRRPLDFLPQKVAYAAACTKLGIKTAPVLNGDKGPVVKDGRITLGNLNAKRDWGHVKDYVRAAHAILQHSEPDVFVIATGEQHSVRDLCEMAFHYVGVDIEWQGKEISEKGINRNTGKIVVEVSPKYFRPSEAGSLRGDYSKAKDKLNWMPEIKFEDLVHELVEHNIQRLLRTER